jgi:hypothetical protein
MCTKNIILLLDLYILETLSFTVTDEQRRWVFEKRALRKIVRLNRNNVVGGWRKLHNTELYTMHFSQNTTNIAESRTMKCVCSKHGREEKRREEKRRELHLIRMSDNQDRYMKNGRCCSQLRTYFKEHMAFRKADESLVCSDKT